MSTTLDMTYPLPDVGSVELLPRPDPWARSSYAILVRPPSDPDDGTVIGTVWLGADGWYGRLSDGGDGQTWRSADGSRDAAARVMVAIWSAEQREVARLVAEAEALGAAMTPAERAESLHRFGEAFDRRAFEHLLRFDPDAADRMTRLGEAAHKVADEQAASDG